MTDFVPRVALGDFDMIKPAITFENARKLFDVVDRNRVEFSRWFRWMDFVHSPEDEFAQLKSIADPTVCKYLLMSGNNDIIGNVGVVEQSRANKTAELGYWLDVGARGRGIMTRAVSAVQDFLFKTGEINRIQIRAAVENMPSRKVALRLGYIEEGIQRQAEVVRDNLIQDVVMYSKLKSEWEKER